MAMGVVNTKIAPMYDWAGVKNIYRTQYLQKPVLATIDHPLFANVGLWFDLPVQGVSRELVETQLSCDKDFKISEEYDEEGRRIPVIPLVVPNAVADVIYAYTVVNNLPQVTRKDLTGLRLKMSIGESILEKRDSGKSIRAVGKICGFVSPELITFAGAPIYWVRDMHLKSGQAKAANHYDRVFLELSSAKERRAIEKKIKKLGLEWEEPHGRYGMLYEWLGRIDYFMWGVAAILILLAAISMFNSFLILATQKRYEFGLYLVFGASPVFLWTLMFLEGAFWGSFHSVLAFHMAEIFSSELQAMLQAPPLSLGYAGSGSPGLSFQISAAEQFSLILGAILFAGGSSLLAGLYLASRKTLALVKKD